MPTYGVPKCFLQVTYRPMNYWHLRSFASQYLKIKKLCFPRQVFILSPTIMKHFFSFKNGDSFMFDPHTYPDCKSETVIRLKADIIESARKAGFRLRREGKARNRINFRCDHNKIITERTERVFKNNKHQQEGTKITQQGF